MKNNIEHIPQESQIVKEVALHFIDGDDNLAISFLRAHKDEVGEFCLQVRDSYAENDKATAFLKLAQLIESLL